MTISIDSMASQQTRIAVEDQYGVMPSSPSWLRTSDMRLIPKPQFDNEAVIGAGDELPSGMILNDDFTNADVTGKAGYVGIMYPISSMFGFPTSTLVSGSTYDHEWTWDGRTPILPASYAFHYGLPGRADEILGLIFNGLGLTVNRGGYDFSTSGFGKAISSNVAMGGAVNEVQTLTVTGTPTALAPTFTFKGRSISVPSDTSWTAAEIQALLEQLPTIGPGNVVCSGGPLPGTPITVTFIAKLGAQDLPLLDSTGTTFTGGSTPALDVAETTPGDDTSVGLPNVPIAPLHFDAFTGDSWSEISAESSKLLALYNAEYGWGEKWQRAMPINSTKSSDGIYVGEDQEHTIGLRFGVDSIAKSYYSNIRAGTKKYFALHATGPATGDSTYKYELVMRTCMLMQSSDGYDSEGGIHVLNWQGRVARDEVLNNAVYIRIRNKQTGL